MLGVEILLWLLPGLGIALGNADHPIVLWCQTYLPNKRVALLAAGLLFVLPADLRRGEGTLSWRHVAHIRDGMCRFYSGTGSTFGALIRAVRSRRFLGSGLRLPVRGSYALESNGGVDRDGRVDLRAGCQYRHGHYGGPSDRRDRASDRSVAASAGSGRHARCKLGFALPISTPPNAIICSTGFVLLGSMIRAGLIIDMIGLSRVGGAQPALPWLGIDLTLSPLRPCRVLLLLMAATCGIMVVSKG